MPVFSAFLTEFFSASQLKNEWIQVPIFVFALHGRKCQFLRTCLRVCTSVWIGLFDSSCLVGDFKRNRARRYLRRSVMRCVYVPYGSLRTAARRRAEDAPEKIPDNFPQGWEKIVFLVMTLCEYRRVPPCVYSFLNSSAMFRSVWRYAAHSRKERRKCELHMTQVCNESINVRSR